MTQGVRMTAAEILQAITEYGRILVAPPQEVWWPLVVITPVEGEPPTLQVAAPLWTKEEGRSDLTMELWLTEFGPGLLRPALLNIHVL